MRPLENEERTEISEYNSDESYREAEEMEEEYEEWCPYEEEWKELDYTDSEDDYY